MQRIAEFEKVSYEKFREGFLDAFGMTENEEISSAYSHIILPTRATAGSAGYDFFCTRDLVIAPGKTVKIPTGIRAKMQEGWVLLLFPRSGLGFKYRLQLNNTVGVIDSDYYYSDNEGQIFAKITNDSREEKTVMLKSGDGFMQGIFLPFGITCEDSVSVLRNGGFGSTSK